MNFDQDTDALELHPESMEENNSIRENITPTQMMEREVNTGSQSQMTINVPNMQQQQMAPQMAPLQMQRPLQRPMTMQQYGQPYFQNYMQTPPMVMNPPETNTINMQLQSFQQMLDKQNNTIDTLQEVFLKIQREVNKLVEAPATPTVWKRNHVFTDQALGLWTCRSDLVTFENHRNKIYLASVDSVTGSNKKVRSWALSNNELMRSMNLIFTGKVNQDQNFTTSSNLTLISHRCDNNLKRAVRASILQQLRSLSGDEKIAVLNDYNMDEFNSSSLNVMKIITVPMNCNASFKNSISLCLAIIIFIIL